MKTNTLQDEGMSLVAQGINKILRAHDCDKIPGDPTSVTEGDREAFITRLETARTDFADAFTGELPEILATDLARVFCLALVVHLSEEQLEAKELDYVKEKIDAIKKYRGWA